MIGFIKYLYDNRVRLREEYEDWKLVGKPSKLIWDTKRHFDASLEYRKRQAEKKAQEEKKQEKSKDYRWTLDALLGANKRMTEK
jgi:hypothetical protein